MKKGTLESQIKGGVLLSVLALIISCGFPIISIILAALAFISATQALKVKKGDIVSIATLVISLSAILISAIMLLPESEPTESPDSTYTSVSEEEGASEEDTSNVVDKPVETTVISDKQEEIPLTPQEQFVSDFCSDTGYTEDTANSLYNLIANDMGFEDISYSGVNSVGNINYDINANDMGFEDISDRKSVV